MKKFAASILFFWLVTAIAARLVNLNPNVIDLNAILSSPSPQYWFGADDLGRDILARVLRGVEVSMLVAVLVTFITMTIGVLIGLLAGFYGNKCNQNSHQH